MRYVIYSCWPRRFKTIDVRDTILGTVEAATAKEAARIANVDARQVTAIVNVHPLDAYRAGVEDECRRKMEEL